MKRRKTTLMCQKKYKKKVSSVIIFLTITLTVFIVTFGFWNTKRLKETVQIQTEQYLEDASQQMIKLTESNIKANAEGLEYLQTYSNTIGRNIEETDFQKLANAYGFQWVGYVNIQGVGKFSDGKIYNYKQVRAFQEALQGKESACALELGEELYIVYTKPIYEGDSICGVFMGIGTKEAMQSVLSQRTFEGESISCIIDEQGKFIVCPKDLSQKEIALLKQIQQAIQQNIDKKAQNKEIELSGEYGTYTVFYKHLQRYPWYLVNMVPSDLLWSDTDYFIERTYILGVLICCLFLLFLLCFWYIFYKNDKNLKKIAFTDNITKGNTKLLFCIEAKKRLQKEQKYTIVSMDIEDFNIVNDVYGNQEGDRTLRYIYNVIKKYLTQEELLTRSYADNYLLFLKRREKQQLLLFLKTIIDDINSFNQYSKTKYYFSIACGIYDIEDNSLELTAMIDRANSARKLKHMQTMGHYFSYSFYKHIEKEILVQNKNLMDRMENAFACNEFQVYLQPKIDIKTKKVCGAEALVRWKTEDGKLIPPGQFIPIFEKNGAIIRLDYYMFREVCKLQQKWKKQGKNLIPISVNFSRCHFKNTDLLQMCKTIYQYYDIAPELLEIELTEGIMLEEPEKTEYIINGLHKIGFSCSMDDFGAGYSSLGLLKTLKFDTLKLDKGFFTYSNEKARGEKIIASIIELAKKLDMKTVAEGIEQRSQIDFLQSVDCDMIQGYVFAKPLPVEEFEKYAF